MSEPIPSRMRGLLLERYDESLSAAIAGLRVVERAVPAVGRGQVLVRMEAAPCNPSDLLFLQGLYGSLKTLPTVPGWEGTGRVVASGGGWLGRWLRGKRVACGLQGDRDGTWAQYFVANATECIPLRRDVPTEQAACLIVNPLTAIGLMDTARRGRHPAAVHTAGASQLGRMLLALARDAGYPMIHVVRREAQVELLRSLGAAHVLNSADPDFAARLEADCAKLRATIAFDAVAGPMTGTVLNAMPAGSVVCVYGDLSNEPCGGINPIDVIFREKTVSGFYLGKWLRSRGLLGTLRVANQAQRMLARGLIATQIQRRLSLEESVTGLSQYVDHMTDGKVLIVPHSKAR